MNPAFQIPAFSLFGETGAFPDVVHCERIRDRARLHDWEISAHRHHEMAQVFVMRQGHAQVVLDGRGLPLASGEFLFVPARFVHGFRFLKGSEGLVLSFPLAVVAFATAGSDDLARSLSRPLRHAANARIAALCDQLYTAFSDMAPFRASLLAALSQALLVAVAQVAAQGDQDAEPLAHRHVLEFDRLIAAHLAEGWSAADYAAAMAITPGHLNRLCRATTGESASRHIEIKVMTEARRLLAFTRLSVAEVGYRLGFDDPPYFSRRFRLLTGETPSAYRARFAGGSEAAGAAGAADI